MSFEEGVLVLFGVFAVIAVTGVAVVWHIAKAIGGALFRSGVRGAVRQTDRALAHRSMDYRNSSFTSQ